MSSRALADFAATLGYDDLPDSVVARVPWLLLDWLGSALAGGRARPVRALSAWAQEMGPADGGSQILGTRQMTSPLFAATVNGAACHVVEQDDLHNGSVIHPGAVVFPAALAVAQATGASGRELLTAAVAGYECGIRAGEFLGRGHYRVFHATATAGTLAAAMTASRLLNLPPAQARHALGSAGTQAAGLWEFLRDAADSKQLHTAKAAADGLLAAYSARYGLTAAARILEGGQGMAAGMLGDGDGGDGSQLSATLGERWALTETSIKLHASCRHTHPAADALLHLCRQHDLDWRRIAGIEAGVHQAAVDVLGAVDIPQNIHQSKFSMGFVLAMIARHGRAGVEDFTESALADTELARLRECVSMVVDADADARYPGEWCARVCVRMEDGAVHRHFLTAAKGDPAAPLSDDEMEQKFRRLCALGGAVSEAESEALLAQCRRLAEVDDCREFLLLG